MTAMRRVVILGAGGRDFHDFNVAFRDDPDTEVVAFTAAQIPGIDERIYPASLAGPRYPAGIRIRPESELPTILRTEAVDEVVLAYSDLSHADVMHKASLVLSLGADFCLLGPDSTMLRSSRPVIAVCATRTGAGKSQTSRLIGRILRAAGLRVALVRHPMPYGDLEAMRVQRFATLADIDEADPTVEEREEYEAPVRAGMVVLAGVDYAEVLQVAEDEADVIVWDGGNNDLSFFVPDVLVTVVDPLRPGHEVEFHPGETNVRLADIAVINKVDTASPEAVRYVESNIRSINPTATIVRAASPVVVGRGPDLLGQRVLVVEDGPTLTHGGMAWGAGSVAARDGGVAEVVDPRPFAVGSIRQVFERYPGLGPVLPAMGYSHDQLADLAETIRHVPCDVVIVATPVDLTRLADLGHPVRRATYSLREIGEPTLAQLLGPRIEKWSQGQR